MFFIVKTHSVLCLLLSNDKFYIHFGGSLEYWLMNMIMNMNMNMNMNLNMNMNVSMKVPETPQGAQR
jgi:hypothetical protein